MKLQPDELSLKARDMDEYGTPPKIPVGRWGQTFGGIVANQPELCRQLAGSVFFSFDYSELGGKQDIRRHFTDAVSGFWEPIEISMSIGNQETTARTSHWRLEHFLGEDWPDLVAEELAADMLAIWQSYRRAHTRAKRLVAASAARAAGLLWGGQRGPNPEAARASLLQADLQLLLNVLPKLHQTKRSNVTRLSKVAQMLDDESLVMGNLVTELTQYSDEPWEVTKNRIRRRLDQPRAKPFIFVASVLQGPLESQSRQQFTPFALDVIEFELASASFKPIRQLVYASDAEIAQLWGHHNYQLELGELMVLLEHMRIGEPYDELLDRMAQRARRVLQALVCQDWPRARAEARILKQLFSNRSTDPRAVPPEWYGS